MENLFLTSLTTPEVRQIFREELKAFFADHTPFFDTVPQQRDQGGIELAEKITGLARQTIYGLVSKRQIPHQKRGKKLYFSEKELQQWITEGRRPTVSEAYAADALATKKR